jgi:hypothetical protein
MKNRIINGSIIISQYNGTSSVTPVHDGFTIDRYKWALSQASKLTSQQSTTAPSGFKNSMLVTSSAATTVGSSDYFFFRQDIEGLNTYDLAWGTASAKTVTLSFQVYSSLTGTFGGSLRNSAGDRSYPFAYTVSSANTWTTISITIAGDTSGTWLTTNGIGISCSFGLGVGSSFSGTAGSWQAGNLFSSTGAVNFVSTSGATFYITGVQLEVGSSATGFEYRQYTTELQLCQRYYYLWSQGIANSTGFMGLAFQMNSTEMDIVAYLPVSMRTTPTLSQTTGTNYYRFYRAGANDEVNSLTFEKCNASQTIVSLYNGTDVSGTAGVCGVCFNNNASSFLAFQAEL